MAHNQFQLLGQRRFLPFFVTQLLGAFNDNVFRNATLALITIHMGLSVADQGTYTNLAPALFILPFFFFSATAGQLAEKYEKTRIIRAVKLFEIVAMALAALQPGNPIKRVVVSTYQSVSGTGAAAMPGSTTSANTPRSAASARTACSVSR